MSTLFGCTGLVGFAIWVVACVSYFQAYWDTVGHINVTEFLLAVIVGILLILVMATAVIIASLRDQPSSLGLTLTRGVLNDILKELRKHPK